MIRCEECKAWNHGKCVKVTQEEAEAIGDFVCSACQRHPERRYLAEEELLGEQGAQ